MSVRPDIAEMTRHVDSTQIRPATVHLNDLLGDGVTQTSATLCLVGQGSTFQMEIPTRAVTT
jgi:hypothetical protein